MYIYYSKRGVFLFLDLGVPKLVRQFKIIKKEMTNE